MADPLTPGRLACRVRTAEHHVRAEMSDMSLECDLGKARVFVDAERNLAIVLLEKVDQSYDVLVTTPIVAASYLP